MFSRTDLNDTAVYQEHWLLGLVELEELAVLFVFLEWTENPLLLFQLLFQSC